MNDRDRSSTKTTPRREAKWGTCFLAAAAEKVQQREAVSLQISLTKNLLDSHRDDIIGIVCTAYFK